MQKICSYILFFSFNLICDDIFDLNLYHEDTIFFEGDHHLFNDPVVHGNDGSSLTVGELKEYSIEIANQQKKVQVALDQARADQSGLRKFLTVFSDKFQSSDVQLWAGEVAKMNKVQSDLNRLVKALKRLGSAGRRAARLNRLRLLISLKKELKEDLNEDLIYIREFFTRRQKYANACAGMHLTVDEMKFVEYLAMLPLKFRPNVDFIKDIVEFTRFGEKALIDIQEFGEPVIDSSDPFTATVIGVVRNIQWAIFKAELYKNNWAGFKSGKIGVADVGNRLYKFLSKIKDVRSNLFKEIDFPGDVLPNNNSVLQFKKLSGNMISVRWLPKNS